MQGFMEWSPKLHERPQPSSLLALNGSRTSHVPPSEKRATPQTADADAIECNSESTKRESKRLKGYAREQEQVLS